MTKLFLYLFNSTQKKTFLIKHNWNGNAHFFFGHSWSNRSKVLFRVDRVMASVCSFPYQWWYSVLYRVEIRLEIWLEMWDLDNEFDYIGRCKIEISISMSISIVEIITNVDFSVFTHFECLLNKNSIQNNMHAIVLIALSLSLFLPFMFWHCLCLCCAVCISSGN